MKKVVLSALAATIVTSAVYAESMTLFSDPKTGQVFTTAGEGRVEMGDFVDAKTVDMGNREQSSALSEYQDNMKKYTNVTSKAKKLDFSGTHYFGLTSATPTTTTTAGTGTSVYPANSTGFEMRRNYVQVKAYFNDKDYFRVTLDSTKELGSNEVISVADHNSTLTHTVTQARNGFANAVVKYAYLYLDQVLPYTGVEIGICHRPWIDYEEHNSWNYRSFNKVLLEEKATATEAGVDLVNSADLGFNLQTKTAMFSSEIGMFNGEGYHSDKAAANQKNSNQLSLEWRMTGHILGDGTKVGKNDRTKDTYANISTYGLMSKNHKDASATIDDSAEYDRSFYGIHAVYNQPEFLLAAQIFTAKDEAQNKALGTGKEYAGWSVNAEYRPIKDWTVIGRYDAYKIQSVAAISGTQAVTQDGTKIIAGLEYRMNKNVSFIGSAKLIDEKADAVAKSTDTGESKDVYMFTTEVKW